MFWLPKIEFFKPNILFWSPNNEFSIPITLFWLPSIWFLVPLNSLADPCTTLVNDYENIGLGFSVKKVSQLDLVVVIADAAWLRLFIEPKSKLNVGCVNDVLENDLNGSVAVLDIVALNVELINILINIINVCFYILLCFILVNKCIFVLYTDIKYNSIMEYH